MHYDMEDLLEQANEIQETMARSYAVPDEIDEDELQAGIIVALIRGTLCLIRCTELDALSDFEDNEPSYLTDATAVPDFLDEAPHVPANEVHYFYIIRVILIFEQLSNGPEAAPKAAISGS